MNHFDVKRQIDRYLTHRRVPAALQPDLRRRALREWATSNMGLLALLRWLAAQIDSPPSAA